MLVRESFCSRMRSEAGRGWGQFRQALAVEKRLDDGAFVTMSSYVARHSRRWVAIGDDKVRILDDEGHCR